MAPRAQGRGGTPTRWRRSRPPAPPASPRPSPPPDDLATRHVSPHRPRGVYEKETGRRGLPAYLRRVRTGAAFSGIRTGESLIPIDRRDLLKRAGASALGLAALGSLRAFAEDADSTAKPDTGERIWAWGRLPKDQPIEKKTAWLDRVAEAGVGAILLGGAIDDVALNLARERGLDVHAWRWTLCRPGRLLEEHPDWYVVNREGVSAAEKPPYVSYYRFLCPSREEVVAHLEKDYAEVAEREGLAGVHLDYVRYPDVILPKALWKKYDLVQDEELPAFDHCYCEVCCALFDKENGIDPRKLEDPPSNEAWRRFRWDSVTRLVNRIAKVVRARQKTLTAAVFPTPEIARRLVRQDWTRWDLDAVLPMVYHGFYEKPVTWIEEAVREGVTALAGTKPLYAGLYVSSLKTEEAFLEAVARARAGGANGVALFGGIRDVPPRTR